LLSFFLPRLAAQKALQIFLGPQRVSRPPSEKNWYESARKFKAKNGLALFEWGVEQGKIVILIHGWNGRGTQLGAFAGPLVEKGYRVIAVDGPAHGDSPGQITSAGDFARTLIELQEEFGAVEAMVGHSFSSGCLVLAVHWGLQVRKLILIAGPARYEVVVQNFFKFIGLGLRAQKEFIRLITEKVGMAPADLDVSKLASSLKIPALIIHDEEDKEVRFPSAQMIHHAWPQSQLLITKGLGHRRILKDSKVIQRVADFIST
jgi:pimeloyl-ACP methyl ester carboxylesterase